MADRQDSERAELTEELVEEAYKEYYRRIGWNDKGEYRNLLGKIN
jgi:hypothetical protein